MKRYSRLIAWIVVLAISVFFTIFATPSVRFYTDIILLVAGVLATILSVDLDAPARKAIKPLGIDLIIISVITAVAYVVMGVYGIV